MQYQCLSDWKTVPEFSGLLDLPNPPKHIFYQGELHSRLFTNCVAVIGSRRITEYGKRVIEKIIPKLVFENKTIISGFMYGADQYAHKICIENGGKTIAILGWGISKELEDEDRKLAESIISSGGLIISEWEHQQPTLWTFPVRNRIVAALSTDIIVVEAAEKSGSLITANLGRKLKRTVWAVPGEITNRLSSGTNQLIKDGHATMWLGDHPKPMQKSDDPLISLLQTEAFTASELSRKLGKPVSDIGAQLSLLSITGQITERGGKYYVG